MFDANFFGAGYFTDAYWGTGVAPPLLPPQYIDPDAAGILAGAGIDPSGADLLEGAGIDPGAAGVLAGTGIDPAGAELIVF